MANDDERDYDEEQDNEQLMREQCHCPWVVCTVCHGKGKSSAHLGALTQDMRDEMDEEWLDDYRAGAFDRLCEECKGRTTIKPHVESCPLYEEPDYAAESERRYFAMMER